MLERKDLERGTIRSEKRAVLEKSLKHSFQWQKFNVWIPKEKNSSEPSQLCHLQNKQTVSEEDPDPLMIFLKCANLWMHLCL